VPTFHVTGCGNRNYHASNDTLRFVLLILVLLCYQILTPLRIVTWLGIV